MVCALGHTEDGTFMDGHVRLFDVLGDPMVISAHPLGQNGEYAILAAVESQSVQAVAARRTCLRLAKTPPQARGLHPALSL